MLLRKALCLALFTGLLVATTGYADVIPFFGKKYPNAIGHIELVVTQVPPEMTLVFLTDKKKELPIENLKGTSHISIHEPGTLFVAPQKQLSTPFSVKQDLPKLIPLRIIEKDDFPEQNAHPVPPYCYCCSLEKTKDAYVLRCNRDRDTYRSACIPCSDVK